MKDRSLFDVLEDLKGLEQRGVIHASIMKKWSKKATQEGITEEILAQIEAFKIREVEVKEEAERIEAQRRKRANPIDDPDFDPDAEIRCPRCNSIHISANKRGFGIGNAAAGVLLLGPVGLVGGLIGQGKVILTCLKCGHSWEVGKR